MLFYSDALTSWNLADSEETAPPRTSPVPKDSEGLSCEHIFHMQMNWFRAHIPNHLNSYTLDHYFPAFVTPGPGNRQLGTAPAPQNPMKLFKSTNSIPAYLALPIIFAKIKVKALAHVFPSLLLLPDWPWCSPGGLFLKARWFPSGVHGGSCKGLRLRNRGIKSYQIRLDRFDRSF